jgi:hypothetical protein
VKLLAENPNPTIDQTNDRLSWFMVGSSIYPQQDAMIWLAPGETRSRQIWPSGTGQIWPSKDDARKQPKEDIVDLHGYCVGGGPVTVFLTIYYTPSSATPDPVATIKISDSSEVEVAAHQEETNSRLISVASKLPKQHNANRQAYFSTPSVNSTRSTIARNVGLASELRTYCCIAANRTRDS